MGLFDALRRLFGGKPAGGSPPPAPPVQPRVPVQPPAPTPPGPGTPPQWFLTDPKNINLMGRPMPPAAGPGATFTPGNMAARTPPPVQPPVRPIAQPPARPVAPAAPPRKRENTKLNLDASHFAPLSGGEIQAELRGKGSSSWEIFRGQGLAWWGNRSIIPPATDARTQYIDRGMVGQGLVTPEELIEMHRVGDEMLRLRPQLDNAAAIAEQAVQQTKQEREARKKLKKAQAEERKKRHAAAVAQRKATDIIYLGRGMSKGLADRRANVEKLQRAGLPVLAAPGELAAALGLTIPQLRWLAFHAEAATRTHYVRFTVPKKSGGTRELAAPHRRLAAAQDWILANILSKIPPHAAAHGFVPGRSTVTNALPHLQPRVLVNCDLKDFFPTITVHRVIGLFAELGFSAAVATILALLCTESPRRVVNYAGQVFHVATGPRCLPQGASTSPAISNLVARRMDSRLAGLTKKLGYTYTRYADDLSFSVRTPAAVAADAGAAADPADPAKKVGYLLARVRHIARDEGFVVNEEKTRVLRRNTSQRVTGIVVNSAELTAPRKIRRRLRAVLHKAKQTGIVAQNQRQVPHFEAHVRGMVSYIQMINPRQGRRLAEALGQVKS